METVKDFKCQEKAISCLYSINNELNYGTLRKSDFIYMDALVIGQPENNRDNSFDLFFKSENRHAFYYYAIEKHVNFFRLRIQFSRKSGMITAVKNGDLESFKRSFINTEKMVGFSMNEAIRLCKWNIVEFLISLNLSYKVENPFSKRTFIKIINNGVIWDAIRWNHVLILKNAMILNLKFPGDWLAYCLYNNSFDVTRYLLVDRRYHLNFKISDLETEWYQKEIRKENQTSTLVRKIMNSWITEN
jgi:hypothetical protein